MGKEALPGISVDWEMKALLMSAVFAVVKILSGTFLEGLFATACRIFFIAGHAFFGFIYFSTVQRINKSSSRTDEEKVAARDGCRDILKSLFIRAVVIGVIHTRGGLIPPLLVSVFMGFFTMIENGYFYQIMYDKIPQIFDIFFR